MKTFGPGATKRRKYIFFDALSFLKPLHEKQCRQSSISDDTLQDQSTADEPTDPTSQPSTSFSRRNKARKQVHEEELMEKLSLRFADRISKEDGLNVEQADSDKLFLLSLYDGFKSIDNNQKINAQIELLNVIQRYSINAPFHSYTPFSNYNPKHDQTQGQSHPYNTRHPPPKNIQPRPSSRNEHEVSMGNVLSPNDSVA